MYKKHLFWLLIISTLIRLIIAAITDFGNDEVYYWTYALYPDWSHFDHPPMVGLVIQLFTLNLSLHSELFIRLASIVFCAVNTYIIFLIGKEVKDELTGFYASLLFTASIYCSIICGTFILPDSPQNLFWLLSLYFLVKSLPGTDRSQPVSNSKHVSFYLILAGFTIGLALLSKYQSAFLWIGAILYIVLYRRKWLKTKELYISVLISVILFIPVIWWNYSNNFISFTFHSGRVDIFHSGLSLDYFTSELAGEVFYNNPVNFILIIISLIVYFKNRKIKSEPRTTNSELLLLCISLPLIIIVLCFSLFVRTLPHWSGPAYTCLIIVAASWLSDRHYKTLIPYPLLASLLFIFFIILFGELQINYGIINLGNNDPSLEMYGWRQLRQKFSLLDRELKNRSLISPDAPIIADKWFPAAHLDYYIAIPLNKKLIAMGDINDIHKYAWINRERGMLKIGEDAYFLNFNNNFKETKEYFKKYFSDIISTDTIKILRNKKSAKLVYVYRLKAYKGNYK